MKMHEPIQQQGVDYQFRPTKPTDRDKYVTEYCRLHKELCRGTHERDVEVSLFFIFEDFILLLLCLQFSERCDLLDDMIYCLWVLRDESRSLDARLLGDFLKKHEGQQSVHSSRCVRPPRRLLKYNALQKRGPKSPRGLLRPVLSRTGTFCSKCWFLLDLARLLILA